MLRLKLFKTKERPITTIHINGRDIETLIDTGAEVSVWNSDGNLFKEQFPDAELLKDDFKISGFGDDGLYTLYKVPDFVLSDGIQFISIINMIIAVGKLKSLSAEFILSANTLAMCDYTVSNRDGYVYIHSDRDTYYMIISCMDTVRVFVQDSNPLLNTAGIFGCNN